MGDEHPKDPLAFSFNKATNDPPDDSEDAALLRAKLHAYGGESLDDPDDGPAIAFGDLILHGYWPDDVKWHGELIDILRDWLDDILRDWLDDSRAQEAVDVQLKWLRRIVETLEAEKR